MRRDHSPPVIHVDRFQPPIHRFNPFHGLSNESLPMVTPTLCAVVFARFAVFTRFATRALPPPQDILGRAPSSITVVTGPNECGKSRFLTEVLSDRQHTTLVDLEAMQVTTPSDFAAAFADAFELSYLTLRSALATVLPFAGGEIFVMKEMLSLHDFKTSLRTVSDALRLCRERDGGRDRRKTGEGEYDGRPIIVVDGLGDYFSHWGENRLRLRVSFGYMRVCVCVCVCIQIY